jgi:hypothetical protein
MRSDVGTEALSHAFDRPGRIRPRGDVHDRVVNVVHDHNLPVCVPSHKPVDELAEARQLLLVRTAYADDA